MESFEILAITRKTADHYARIAGALRRDGNLTASNDLWIAAVALENNREFLWIREFLADTAIR